MNKRLGWDIERIILLIIIIASALDFFSVLPPFYAYIMDIVGWTSIAYLIYVVSPTEIIFGNKTPHLDLAIIASFILLSLKDIIGNAIATIPELTAKAGTYISFAATNATEGVYFAASQAEINSFNVLHIMPRSNEIAIEIAKYFTTSQQQVNVILGSESAKAAAVATPLGQDGMMLMFYNTLAQNSAMIQTIGMLVGFILLALVAIYAASTIEVKKPSVLSMIKEEGKPSVGRALIVFLLLAAFFVMVFNLLFEWMTVTDDAPLLFIILFVVAFMYFAKHLWKRSDDAIEVIESGDESFYEKALLMLKDKATVLLIISGLLVLHLLTDVGNYLIPTITGTYKTLYMMQSGFEHTTLYSMIAGSIAQSQGLLQTTSIITMYILSLAGIMALLILPAVIWYKLFKLRSTKNDYHIPDWKGWHVGIIMACITAFMMMPIFSIDTLDGGNIVGISLNPTPIGAESFDRIWIVLGVCVAVFAVCTALGFLHDHARRIMMLGPFGSAVMFFGFYIYNYFISIFNYYSKQLVSLINQGISQGLVYIAIVPIMFVLFSLTIVFFVTGFVSFLYEIWRD